MSRRLTAAISAGALVVGILTGAASAVVVGNATTNAALDRHTEQMGSMMEMMGTSGMGSMMEMMGGSMGDANGMGPTGGEHRAHHPDSDQ